MIRFFNDRQKTRASRNKRFWVRLNMTIVRGDGTKEPRTRETVTPCAVVIAKDAAQAMSKARGWYQKQQSATCKYLIHDATASPASGDTGTQFVIR